ncbi:MAG: chorismate mutase [Terrimicrobiaceae bacterium]|nr:chorismate mutase [Terrimicrobiaceae bacterium]
MSDLSEIREKIDAIDLQLLRLLNERATLALEIGRIKSRDGLPIYAPDREIALLRGLVEKSEGPLSPAAIRAIYREIMSAALALEKNVVIGCFGPEGGACHQAAKARFGSSVTYTFFPEVGELFEAIGRGEGDCGVVPIEQAGHGAANQTLDALAATDLTICAEITSTPDGAPAESDSGSRYFVMARTATAITGNDRTTLLLRIENKPGALVDALEPFRAAELNLSHLASRPASKGSKDVFFFVEVDGHARDEDFGGVLRELSRSCRAVKVLGSFAKTTL